MIFVTGDQHFDHANILRYCHRDFKDVDVMNAWLIDEWNRVVHKFDTVYHLGDFLFGNIERANDLFAQLNGEIHVLAYPFHHDKMWLPESELQLPSWVHLEPPLMVLEHNSTYVTLCHFPLEVWDRKHYYQPHLHGHSHGVLDAQRTERILDVGVDNAFRLTGEYRPFALYEALEIIDKRVTE